jgi:uncharacterized membrane protein YeaQ/YmgE (transglycosylase-associated protein family)
MDIFGYSILELLLFLGLALFFGGLAQALAGYSAGGCLLAVVFGFLGAWLGAWVARELALPTIYAFEWNGQFLPLVWPAVGALLFGFILNLVVQWFMVGVVPSRSGSSQSESG